MTGTVHDRPSKQTFEARWVLNHQFLRIQEKSEERVAFINGQPVKVDVPFEALFLVLVSGTMNQPMAANTATPASAAIQIHKSFRWNRRDQA